jgi:hypothetical protein
MTGGGKTARDGPNPDDERATGAPGELQPLVEALHALDVDRAALVSAFAVAAYRRAPSEGRRRLRQDVRGGAASDRAALETRGDSAVRDSAGVTIVESYAPLWSDRGHWVLDPVPLATIGLVDGPAPYLFTSIAAGALDLLVLHRAPAPH